MRTDGDGRFRLAAPSNEPFWFQVENAELLPRLVFVQPHHLAAGRVPSLGLVPQASARGRVVGAAGQALDGVMVTALGRRHGRRPFFDPDPADSRALTGETGELWLRRLTGERPYTVRASLAGYQTADFELPPSRYVLGLSNPREHLAYDEVLEIDGDRFIELDLSSARVGGVVRSAAGAPIAGARVVLQRLGDQGAGSLISIGSDADGRFAIPRAPAGVYRLGANKDGFASASRQLEVQAGVDLSGLEIVLSPTDGLELFVHFADGRRPAYVQIGLFDDAGRRVLTESRPVDTAGRVRVPSAPPGSWQPVMTAPGALATRRSITVPAEGVELTLAVAGGLRLQVPALFTSDQVAALELLGDDSHPFESFDLDGVVRRRWSLEAGAVEGIPPGNWTARVFTPDSRVWVGAVFVTPGGVTQLVIE